MASIILSSAGSALGATALESVFGATLATSIGKLAGSMLGNYIDNKLFGQNQTISGTKISEFHIQTSSYGQMIPIVYGTSLIAGNIIWMSNLKEIRSSTTRRTSRKGPKLTSIEYSYQVSLAIALCEGEINKIDKIFIDEEPIDMNLLNVTIYKGIEDQLPDPILESHLGIGKTPAYRGLCYVVIHNLEIQTSRIPNFTFEVTRNMFNTDNTAEGLVECITLIPGCGEFVYDTLPHYKADYISTENGWIQKGKNTIINKHVYHDKTDFVAAIDNLKTTLPNLKWVAPVVSWFGTSDNIDHCKILPGVEYKGYTTTTPTEWQSREFNRQSAHSITHINNRPIYGGTPSDQSVIRMLEHLKLQNLKVMFYPMIFIDLPHKPWRGHLTGSPVKVKEFFDKEYKPFILHYANLVKGKIDAFIIGSEFKTLTSIQQEGAFPAVQSLIEVAKVVKEILGKEVTVTYAADWSEYHHIDGGYRPLDELWASEWIDVIGIDAYFPLTNSYNSVYDRQELINAWNKGEGYDFYYEDSTKKVSPKPLSADYAWKNIEYWWSSEHFNPDGTKTPWVPKSKKIWFTEYGFPSINCSSNQPNVFYDPSTTESAVPIHSNILPDLLAQRRAIEATELRWKSSEMVDNKFLWTWDARPYPAWPNYKDLWTDVDCWHRGHWVQGKLGQSSLGEILKDLTYRTILHRIEVSELLNHIQGFVLAEQTSVKRILETLQLYYFFDFVFEDNILKLKSRTNRSIIQISNEDIISFESKILHELELPKTVNLLYLSPNYQLEGVFSKNHLTSSEQSITLSAPVILSEDEASRIADTYLSNLWLERNSYNFSLPSKYSYISVGDIVYINGKMIRVVSIKLTENRALLFAGVEEDLNIYSDKQVIHTNSTSTAVEQISETKLEILDIPYLPFEELKETGRVLIAACGLGKNWSGANLYKDNELITTITNKATMGSIVNELSTSTKFFDNRAKLTVSLLEGELFSITIDELCNYGNLALIGNEIIQFQNAKLIDEYTYEISGLLRGRFGTTMTNHKSNERFVLLDRNLSPIILPNYSKGQKFDLRVYTINSELALKITGFTYNASCLKNFYPCHLTYKNGLLSWIPREVGTDSWDITQKIRNL